MRNRLARQLAISGLLLGLASAPAAAITIRLDYTYDSNNFFSLGSPARASVEAAAGFFSTILDDTFDAIVVPQPVESTAEGSDGAMNWFWTMNFNNPSTGAEIELTNPPLPADEYVVFAGARNHTGSTAGVGGPGGRGWGRYVTGTNSFGAEQGDQIEQITDDFFELVQTRGEASGFANWGGTISFDNSSRNWHFDHTTPPSGSATDLYSVAIHELAHALGFGQNDNDAGNLTAWERWVSGTSFQGGNAIAEYGGSVPLAADQSHWVAGTPSVVYGGSTAQETAMDPDITSGTRKRFTALDAAAMMDLGWTVVPLPGLSGDYNDDGVIDAADYVVWRKRLHQNVTIPNDQTPGTVTTADYAVWRANFGRTPAGGAGSFMLTHVPEPTGIALALVGGMGVCLARRRRRR